LLPIKVFHISHATTLYPAILLYVSWPCYWNISSHRALCIIGLSTNILQKRLAVQKIHNKIYRSSRNLTIIHTIHGQTVKYPLFSAPRSSDDPENDNK